MTSMTGFGHGELREPAVHVTVEIRSYNNRFLDIFLNLPGSLKQLEPRMREFLASRVRRGKVEMYVGLTEIEEDCEVFVDSARASAYASALRKLAKLTGAKPRIDLSHLLGLEGVLKSESRKDPDAMWALLTPLLESVFAGFEKSRQAEGAKTEQDLRKSADAIRGRLAEIEAAVPQLEARIKEGLRERFREMLGEGIDESRILAETAVQLMRADVNEEIQRMKAHLATLEESLGAEGPQGKRLDFVCQELGREINTIGSKSASLQIDQAVIAVKDSLEKIREQIRNVE